MANCFERLHIYIDEVEAENISGILNDWVAANSSMEPLNPENWNEGDMIGSQEIDLESDLGIFPQLSSNECCNALVDFVKNAAPKVGNTYVDVHYLAEDAFG